MEKISEAMPLTIGAENEVPEAFQQARKLYLVIHITMPKADPVITIPLIMELTPGADGEVLASPVVF